MKGWIKLHRSIQDHWIYQEKRKFSKYEAWLDLIMMANHDDNKTVIDNELIEVKRGQKITSIRNLCERWRWSNTKVTQFLKLLQGDGMATIKSDTKKTAITIEKYGVYQGEEDGKATHNRRRNDTEQTQKHTNNNVKECSKNDKEKKTIREIKDLRTSYSPELITLIDTYWSVMKKTRKTNSVSYSVILKTMQKWTKYDQAVIKYALKKHIESYDDGERNENYTLGIMRNTTPEEAEDILNKKVTQFRRERHDGVDRDRTKGLSGNDDYELSL